MVLVNGEPVSGVRAEERSDKSMRVAHLLRINSYLDIAIISMWTASPRADVMVGMVEASLRHEGPGGLDGELLQTLRDLVSEGREYYRNEDFAPAMGRMRVAHDKIALYIIGLAGE